MAKYPIGKEFGIYRRLSPPINRLVLSIAAKTMKPPKLLWKDTAVTIEKNSVKSYGGEEIAVYTITPRGLGDCAPCLLYNHGGAFVLEAAKYHYALALRYARETGCKVVFPQYRLAPKYPFPVFFEDCYAAFLWAYDGAETLGIDRNRIGIGGDSAGSALAVSVCRMAHERGVSVRFRFQMLLYPYLDARNKSESARKYTDTPMWNSLLSGKMHKMTRADRNCPDFHYYSPVEAGDFGNTPPTYIETAEFDCLHDDGVLYAGLLSDAGVPVELCETQGTMHGYDIALDAGITQKSVEKRIAFMKKYF